MYYIHKHRVSQQYGGPEEGGWYFDAGTPDSQWQVIPFLDEDLATDCCRALNFNERLRRDNEEDFGYTSVLAYRSEFFSYDVKECSIMKSYPEVKPHYE